MHLTRTACARLVGLIALTLSATPAVAQSGRPRVFVDAAACKASHLYDDAQCETAYRNAKAELDEKAPKFSSRGECERYFRRCMIAELLRGGREARLQPAMRGFAVENGPRRQVTPVVDGDAGNLFSPRSIDRRDETVLPARVDQARLAWKQFTTPHADPQIVHVPAGPDGTEAPASASGQTYPVPKTMLQDMQSRERRLGAATEQ